MKIIFACGSYVVTVQIAVLFRMFDPYRGDVPYKSHNNNNNKTSNHTINSSHLCHSMHGTISTIGLELLGMKYYTKLGLQHWTLWEGIILFDKIPCMVQCDCMDMNIWFHVIAMPCMEIHARFPYCYAQHFLQPDE